MLNISIWLTIVVLVVLFLIMQFAGIIMKKSGRYFMAQQKTLADLDGYIEEMINGQKVIKVFCHEGKAREEMVRRNKLYGRATVTRDIPTADIEMKHAMSLVRIKILKNGD